jgi:type IV pilus assembly protein PilM
MQTVTMAVFDAAPGGALSLQKYAQADLLPDPAADASRAGQLRVVLSELRAATGWKSGAVACAIPSQGVFARFVQIPQVDPEKIDQMLFFEAQQNVPYPIEEVVWGYQVLPEKGDGKLNALIIATKSDALADVVDALEGAKLVPDLIETSTVALYNAFRFNYPDLRGCSLLIDIGARTTNLLFIEQQEVFIRTLPIGGNSITAALHKKFEPRTFQEVEDFKRAEGLIPPPGNYAGAKNEEVAEMGKIARTVMTRIHNEITRSITYYRTNQKGAAPMQAFLAGGGVSLPYALEFFNEKLSLPIEFFNPLRRVKVEGSVDAGALAKSAHRLGGCVGLALQTLHGDCPVEISLKSEGLESAKAESARRPYLLAAAALLVSMLALVGLYYRQATVNLERVNSTLDARIAPLSTQSDQIRAVLQKRDRLLREEAEFAALPMLRTGWAALINELNAKQPDKFLWITKLAPYPPVRGFNREETDRAAAAATGTGDDGTAAPAITALLISGLYLDNPRGPAVVDDYVSALAGSPLFDITADSRDTVVKIRATPTGNAWAYEYQLLVPLKRPIPL